MANAGEDGSGPKPRLRIEAGAHTARLNAVSINAAETLLLTASDDKTARLWSLPDFRPIAVLRPPIGPLQQGMLYAAALSPDGTLAAVGGWTPGGAPNAVHVFDVARGDAIQVLHGLPDVVNALRFSPDGGRLAGGLGSGGLRVWRTTDWALVGDDPDYLDAIVDLEFAPAGNALATASFDGRVRLYGEDLVCGVRTDPQGDALPRRLSFSPDAAALAIGYSNAAWAEIRDAGNLQLRLRVSAADLGRRPTLEAVGWSADGTTLFAAGNATLADDERVVLRWGDQGRGARSIATIPGLTSSNIGRVAPRRDGRLLVASLNAELALYDADGRRVAVSRRGGGDLLTPDDPADEAGWTLRLSRDASIVEWTFRSSPRRLRFDARRPVLEADSDAAMPGLAAWSPPGPGLAIPRWHEEETLTLNGFALAIEGRDRVVSIDAKHGHVLLGADFGLYRYRADATLHWHRHTVSPAFRVNQSPDGKLAVAALLDGTIRWYRLEDGEELLALFVTDEAPRRWVAFTPAGYYAAGPGGEDLIGWHLDRGPDLAADFFPASAFHERFYRPDVVQRVLPALDEAAAVRGADAARGGAPTPTPAQQVAAIRDELPPVVTIVLPRDGALLPPDGSVVVAAEIRSPAGRGVQEILLRVDDHSVSAQQPVGPLALAPPAPGEAAWLRLLAVELGPDPRPDATLSLRAVDDAGRISAASTVRLTRPPAPAVTGATRKPRLIALIVGVSAYERAELRQGVGYAAKDARDLLAALRRQEGGLYRDLVPKLLVDADATRDGMLDALDWLRMESVGSDTALLFLAGHGMATASQEYFFLSAKGDPERPDRDGLPGTVLHRKMREVQARRVALLDTCYAGAAADRAPAPWAPNMDAVANQLSADSAGVIVFSATRGNQRAAEIARLQNGVFTHALLEALRAPRGGAEAELRVSELWSDLDARVRALTGDAQKPTFVTSGSGAENLPLFACGC